MISSGECMPPIDSETLSYPFYT